MEGLLHDVPEDVGSVGQRDAVQEQRNAHLANVRVLRVANVPEAGMSMIEG